MKTSLKLSKLLAETECPNCGNEMILHKWQFEKHKEDKDYYCSEGCRYNSETGHSAEEY